MTTHRSMPQLTLRRVANGWIVEPHQGADHCYVSSLSDIHVFQNWGEAAEFMRAATTEPYKP